MHCLEWRLRLVTWVALLKLLRRHWLHRLWGCIIWWTHLTNYLRSIRRCLFNSCHLTNRWSSCTDSFRNTRDNLPALVVYCTCYCLCWFRAHRCRNCTTTPAYLLIGTVRRVCFSLRCLTKSWTVVSFTGWPVAVVWGCIWWTLTPAWLSISLSERLRWCFLSAKIHALKCRCWIRDTCLLCIRASTRVKFLSILVGFWSFLQKLLFWR